MNLPKKSITIYLLIALGMIFLVAACAPSGGPDDYQENNWKLLTIDGEPAIPGVTVTALFDGSGGLTGFAGCNDYVGTYGVGGDQLQINLQKTTTNLCDEAIMAQERAFIEAMGIASNFEFGDDPDVATVNDIKSRPLMTMERFTP